MNLSNSSNQSFIITNTLCMQFPDNTSQCSAAAGGTSWINFNSTACLTGGNISTSGTAGVNASCLISAMGITNGTNGINGTNGVNGTNGLNGTNGINGTGFMVNVSSFSSCPTGGNTYYGYTINTSGGYVWNWSIQICNGLNGVNGTNGTNGINGTNGNNFTYSDWFNQNLNTTSNVTFANIYNKTSTNSSFNFTQICSANQWVISIATGGGTCAQVAFANLSGTVTDAQMTNQKLNVTDQRYNETSLALSLGNWSGNISSYTNTTEIPTLMGNSTISRIGNCTAGQFVQNTTTSGVQCATPTGGAGGGITTVQAANASIIVQNGTVSNFSVNMTFINANIPTYNNGTSNLTIAQVAASIGNWSADKSNYYNISATNSSFNFTKTCSANQWVTSVATGGGTCAQVAFANLSGTVTDAQMANQKLNVTDQRYNETARIDAINTSATILPLYASVQKDPQGFNDKTSDEANQHSTVAFNTITRNFTIQPNGTSYSYYFAGNLITVTTNKSLVIANTSGVHIIYFNSTGDLAETGSISSNILCDNVIVAAINWNTAGYQYIAQDERHTHFMECETHYYLHEHVGTQYDSGLNAIWTTAGGTSSNASAQANVSAGSISDEDYTHNIAGYNSTTGGNFRVYYQIGATGNWSIKNADQFPFIWSDTTTFNGTSGRMAYNLNTAGVWSLTTATSTDYVLIHFFATNSMDNTRDILVVQGQNQYTSAALATTGATTEISNIIGSGLFATEFKPLYSMLLLTNTGYTNAPKAIFMAPSTGGKYIDWRYSSIVGTTGAIGGTVTSVTAGTGITINGVAGATMTATGTVAANPSVVALQNQINNFTSAQNFTTTTYLYNNTNPYNASIYEYWNATCKIIVTSTGRMELC